MLAADGLTKRYGKVLAVDDLSFRVRPGTLTAFLGPNGAGKTTTLRIFLGLVHPTSGAATIDGKPYRELEKPARVGAVLEATGFYPGRSGRNHLRAVAAAAGVPAGRIDEVLGVVGLEAAADRRVGGYSLGMRQRLGIATALLGEPEVLVLDEPANGLDPDGIHWIREFMRDYVRGGRTILVSSHVLAEVAQVADEVVIIDKGRLVAQAPVAELTARASGAVRVRSPQADRLRELLGAETVAESDGVLLVRGRSAAEVGELAAGNGIVLHELVQETATLEEAFLELTRE
ncbi:MAG TPA: ABC transporter ATP-binding protein [Gaiellaceae bacterium]|nr:ABC transporter ATP-binding protein [Gaiellaceae bacterium]